MRIILVVNFIFLFISVDASSTDTLFFNAKWKQVESNRRFTYQVLKEKIGNTTVQWVYSKRGDLLSYGEYSDENCSVRDGNFYWLERRDTLAYEWWRENSLKMYVGYEGAVPVDKRIYVNDTTQYSYTLSGGKYYTSKKLFIGDLEYHFYGIDSALFLNNLRYAFHNKFPSADFFIIKFKVLPWVFAEDVGMIYSLGLEYTIRKRHSFDLTASYFDWDQDQEDNYGNPLPSIYNVRRSLQFGYRWYLPVQEIISNSRYFISPFIRYGRWQDFYMTGAITDHYKNISDNYTAGIVFGIAAFRPENKNEGSYTELFIGPQYVYRETTEGIYANNIQVENDFITQKIGIRFGLNFCFLRERK